MVAAGVAVTEAPDPDDKELAGAHENVGEPLAEAVNVVGLPGQMDIEFDNINPSPELTVTVASAVPGQPVALEPVTL